MSHEQHIPVHEQRETTHLSSEQLKQHHEQLEKSRQEQAERTRPSNERDIMQAEQLAKVEAQSSDEIQKTAAEEPQTEKRGRTSEDKAHSFATTMHHVRRELSSPERTFSKLIHQPIIEKTSEVAGKTIARPSGIVGATIAACIGLLSIYSIAQFAGFSLSGSEMPLLLAIGFVLGLIGEWAYKAVRTIVAPQHG